VLGAAAAELGAAAAELGAAAGAVADGAGVDDELDDEDEHPATAAAITVMTASAVGVLLNLCDICSLHLFVEHGVH
jgi:hypothetical protein